MQIDRNTETKQKCNRNTERQKQRKTERQREMLQKNSFFGQNALKVYRQKDRQTEIQRKNRNVADRQKDRQTERNALKVSDRKRVNESRHMLCVVHWQSFLQALGSK